MRDFLFALQFLTIIPVKIRDVYEKRIPKSMIYFPLVGLLLGLILAGANGLLSFFNFEPYFINVMLVILLIVLTGGIHLDGLADTTDALLSGKDREEMLEIMRDSRIGVMGTLGLISIILLKIALVSALTVSLKTISLILMCVLSRWSLVFAMFLFPYAREDGKAKLFIQGINFKIFILATMLALISIAGTGKLSGLLVFAISAIGTYIINKFITRKIGGITGDTLGATNELIEIIILFSICILERINLWII